MKKKLIGLCAGLAFLCMVGMAQATLFDQGNGVIFDDVAKQYWYQDLSAFTNQTLSEQLASIEALNNPVTGLTSDDYGDWRMAQYVEDIQNLEYYDGKQITDKFIHAYQFYYPDPDPAVAKTTWFYYGRIEYALANPDHHWVKSFLRYIYDDGTETSHYGLGFNFPDIDGTDSVGVWIVADAAPVPEPATMMLLGTGLAGLAAFRKKFKK